MSGGNNITNSHDVVSLFNNVHIKKAMEVIRKKIEEDKKLSGQTNLDAYNAMGLLEFVMSTMYFQLHGQYYQQVHGAPMGNFISVVTSDMFTEYLDEEAMVTALLDMRPKIWHRYIENSVEVIRRDKRDELMAHLNTINKTVRIKFTNEPEKDMAASLFKSHIRMMGEGVCEGQVYRKVTHMDQYLSCFRSHHLFNHKLGVICTLYDQCDNIVTVEADATAEIIHVDKALDGWVYFKWPFRKVGREWIRIKQER